MQTAAAFGNQSSLHTPGIWGIQAHSSPLSFPFQPFWVREGHWLFLRRLFFMLAFEPWQEGMRRQWGLICLQSPPALLLHLLCSKLTGGRELPTLHPPELEAKRWKGATLPQAGPLALSARACPSVHAVLTWRELRTGNAKVNPDIKAHLWAALILDKEPQLTQEQLGCVTSKTKKSTFPCLPCCIKKSYKGTEILEVKVILPCPGKRSLSFVCH